MARILKYLALIGIAVLLGYFTIRPSGTSPYRQFVGQGTNYFAQVASACDSILQQHPLGTNAGLFISSSDSTIPKVIQDLHPSAISIESEPTRVWFMIGKGKDGFGVAWEHHGPNVWLLKTTHDQNVEKTVYTKQ